MPGDVLENSSDETAWLRDAAAGRLGWTVRCTPRARTVRAELPDGDVRFAKGRVHAAAARAEMARLLELQRLGFRVPAPCGICHGHGGHWLGLESAPGKALQVLWRDALGGPDLRRHAVQVLAPWVARLHGTGLVHRDLYGNHLFAEGLFAEPVVIDVERMFRPRWRRDRWWIKDLSALWSSRPDGTPERIGVEFLVRWMRARGWPSDARRRLLRSWLPRIGAKAEGMRTRRPRYG